MPDETPGTEGTLMEAEAARVPPTRSSNASGDVGSHLEQHKLIVQNFDLVFKRVNEMASILKGSSDALESTRREMVTTLELQQQMIARQDEQIEKLGEATAALLEYLESQGQTNR